MQIFIKKSRKSRKYLHICNFCCTFVADFGNYDLKNTRYASKEI